jgi:hypothetical protein
MIGNNKFSHIEWPSTCVIIMTSYITL